MRGATTADVVMELGPYRVSDVLGDGATGIVYRATAPGGHEVAIKVLRKELSLSERERRRFLDEADRMRRVRHPALVEVIDAGILPDGLPFIAMPFLHGATLADRLRRGPMRFDVALRLFEELADGVHTLHRAGLVHRDIKPENIFVADGDARALLLDLGIAREVDASPSTTTHAGMIRGTPAYMAPERFFGAPATPATDIYELAVVLYVTLVGALPWQRFDDPTERMRPAPPLARGVVLPPKLATTLMRALAVSPGERPASAHDFAAAVMDALSPDSAAQIANQATAFSPSLAPPAGGAPAAFAATAMAPVPYTGSGIRAVAHAPTIQAPVAPTGAEPPKRKSGGLLVAAMTGASLLASAVGAVIIFIGVRAAPPGQSPIPAQQAGDPAAEPRGGVVAPAAPSVAPIALGNDDLGASRDRKEPPTDDPKARISKPRPPHSRGVIAPPPSPTGTSSSPPKDDELKPTDKKKFPPPPPVVTPSARLANCAALLDYACSEAVQKVEPSECPSQKIQSVSRESMGDGARAAADAGCRARLEHFRFMSR
ncbi:MAG: protein kinase [Polyangiaceae bacterium]